MASMAGPPPPPYYRTIYDETFRSVHYETPAIASMANLTSLVGQLEHHSPSTDGSFSICVANGRGVFITRALLESIPAEHRPALDTSRAGQEIQNLTSEPVYSIGTTLIPVILTNAGTGEKFRIVLHAIVVPNLYIHMFIGQQRSPILRIISHRTGVPVYSFTFNGSENESDFTRVQGI